MPFSCFSYFNTNCLTVLDHIHVSVSSVYALSAQPLQLLAESKWHDSGQMKFFDRLWWNSVGQRCRSKVKCTRIEDPFVLMLSSVVICYLPEKSICQVWCCQKWNKTGLIFILEKWSAKFWIALLPSINDSGGFDCGPCWQFKEKHNVQPEFLPYDWVKQWQVLYSLFHFCGFMLNGLWKQGSTLVKDILSQEFGHLMPRWMWPHIWLIECIMLICSCCQPVV